MRFKKKKKKKIIFIFFFFLIPRRHVCYKLPCLDLISRITAYRYRSWTPETKTLIPDFFLIILDIGIYDQNSN